MIFCFISRAVNIFPLSFIANLFRKKAISFKMQIMIWFAGLRGAIAFALSNNMPEAHADLYISTTLSIVLFTTIIVGGLTEPMIGYTGMRLSVSPPPSPDYSMLVSTPDPTENEEIIDNGLESKLAGMIYRFDRQYMQPLFGSESIETPTPSDPSDTEMVHRSENSDRT
jgi:hypothetical protein